MKKLIGILLSICLILGFSVYPNHSAEAAAKKFKNCTQLNKVYKGGVAKSAKVKNKGGKTRYKPYVSSSLYNANKKLDRDKDGIACER
ncbi:calcium-binding protein [Aeribacillus pallidus]|uniref:Calcium-binding protein n=1 Tax=Aeribacillus pallidus TaxID=33936 RepID=A0A161ZTH3_9BACI|nr:excalibur calcium-binding domain-containing protein [Aeribacillus pallidus]KZM54945.1 calcium-binding protein [Aeribacillus pallidus]KZN96457.1 calcium-binding protein [Aeribacillus pallidus]